MDRSTDRPARSGNGRTRDAPLLRARVAQPDAARLYDRLAGVYDLWGHLAESRARRRTLELAAVKDGERVLEVAVGTGLAFIHLVRGNPDGDNVGIDISAGMLARARARLRRERCDNFTLCRASAMALPVPGGAFDVLINNYMFDLLDETLWPTVLGEFRRVLKPAGRLVLADMTAGEKPGSSLYESLYRISPHLMGGCRGVRLATHLADNGFVVHTREYFQQMLFPSEVIMATPVG